MDKKRIIAGHDNHKDNIYLRIMGHDEAIILKKLINSARILTQLSIFLWLR